MNSLIPSHIQVTVVRARDLALKSKSVNSDVFAVIQVEKEKEVTQLLPRHSCPQWNQSFDIPLMSLDSSVDITVKQKTKFTEEFLGYIRVPFNHLSISRRPRQNWHKLGPRPGKTSSKLRGDVLISLAFLYKWDSVETQTPPTSPSFETGDRKMLRRTKSEHRGGAKQERAVKSKGSIFGRTKSKKNSQVFEDSDDFVALSIRSSGDPPTPPQSERRKQLLLSSSSPDGTDSYDASTEERSSSPNRLLFTEATHQLEKTGIVDLWRADPVMRREAVKQHIRGNELSKLGSSSSVKKDSSFDSSYEEEATRHSASTPTNTPTRSNTITYRAKSTPRRRERTNSFGNPSSTPKTPDEKQGVTPHTSNTSLESNTSEYYSGSSSVTTTPSTCNTLVSCDSETTPTNTSTRPKDVAPSVSLRKVSKDDTKASPTLASHSPPKRGKLKRGTTVDTPSSYSTLPHRHSNAHAGDHSFSTLQRNPTRDGERPKPRNPQHQYLSAGDNNIKRHSADIEQILKLSSLSQGRNDGLENVLNTGQLKQLLQKRNSRGKGGEAGVSRTLPKSQPNSASSLVSHQPLSPPVNNKDGIKDTPTVNKDMPAANEATPTLTNDTPTDAPHHHDKAMPTLSNETHPQQENENQAEVNEDPLHNGPLSNGDDHVTSTCVTHENPKVGVPILVETPISSGSTTPSRMSPPLTSTDVTRETTPSPDHEEREGEDDTDDGKEEEGSVRVEAKKKHTVEYKRSFDGGNNFQPFHPLPPSVVAVSATNSSSSSPSHYAQKKYSSTTDITTLLNQCKEIVSTGNKMELSSVTGTHSATTSGRTSPAIVEEEEEEGQKPGEAGKENATPISTTPSSTSPPTVQSAPKPSTSVSRRKIGGGLKRTLSLYQENRKQAVAPSKGKRTLPNIDATPARPLRRNSSSTSERSKRSGETTDKPIANPLPLPPPSLLQSSKHLPTSTAASTVTAVSVMGGKTSLGASFTASKSSSNASKSTVTKQHDESDKMVTPNGLLSSHETHHSSSQSNTSTPTLPPVTSHFTLPPPPPPMEELGQSDSGTVAGSRGREVVTSVSTDFTSSTSSYSEAESSCTPSSSEVDEEETTVEDYRDWSKEALISELLRTKSKLKRKTMEFHDTKSYLEILLVKVMDSNPELLLSDSSS